MSLPARLLLSAIVAVCALLAAAQNAAAATATVASGTLTYVGGSEVNTVRVTQSGSSYVISDPGRPITLANGTTVTGTATFATSAVTSVVVDTGAGDDSVTVVPSLRSTLSGGPGADSLTGGPAVDTLNGGDDNDTLNGGTGADTLIGGGGRDLADYSARTRPLAVTLDDVAGDGESGEGDNVASDVERVSAGSGADTLAGSDSDNELRGNAGTDTLRGGGGDDLLRGGDSADLLSGGDGNDDLGGDNGDDSMDGGWGGDRIAGGSGTDLADYSSRGSGVDLSVDGAADDGEPGEGDNLADDVEKLTGGAGDDHIAGGALANTITGGGGNDRLDGGAGADTLAGGDGEDVADYGSRGGPVTVDLDNGADDGESGERDNVRTDVEDVAGGQGDDRLTGDADVNALIGNGGADAVYGGRGDDALDGGDGEDTLRGEGGADRLSGGGGSDLADYSDRSRGVQVALDGIANDGEAGESDDVAGDVERVTGGSGDDKLAGDGADNVLSGAGGRDVINAGPGNDLLDGGAGDDTLQGGAGADRLAGGAGSDWADYSDRAAVVVVAIDGQTGDGEPGENDAVDGDVENVRGGTGDDRLTGSGARNSLDGGDGADVLDGAGGADTLTGGAGADTADYSSRAGAVTVSLNGQAGDGEAGENDRLAEDVENVRGGSGADRIAGNDDPNRLDGGEGDDSIGGGAGDDVLIGLGGADKIDGGAGKDRFDGGAGNDTIDARDTVRDPIDCGAGTDTARLDKKDTKPRRCEKRILTGGGSSGTDSDTPATDVNSGSGAKGSPVGVKTVKSKGRIVSIPGSPGERVDRRLLKDIAWMKRKYHIAITDGFALSGHAEGGEHPIGVAIDIVPGPGGSWNDVDKLAKWAEPRQNAPRAPFRWVGYNGDSGHGRGNHLHLSWRHGSARKGHPPSWVQVLAFKGSSPSGTTSIPSLERFAFSSNSALGRPPRVKTGLPAVARCSGSVPLKPTWKAAGKAFRIKWQVIAAITQVESGFGCNMGPSSAGAIGWTQFMPATWSIWGMDASGDGKADPYNSTDAIFSTARYLRASGAPGDYGKAVFAYNHADWYVKQVLALSRKFK